MEKEKQLSPIVLEESSINLREELEKYLYYWKWFLLSLIIAGCIAFVKVRYSHPVYSASINVLIKNSSKSGGLSDLAGFNDLSLLSSGNNVNNEIHLFKSRTILKEVIKNLHLDVSYYSKGKVLTTESYGNIPINVQFIKKENNLIKENSINNFIVKILSLEKYQLLNNAGKELGNYYFNDTIKDYNICILNNFSNINNIENKEIIVRKPSLTPLAFSYQNRLNISNIKGTSILKLTLKDRVRNKAIDILNELVSVYNKDAIDDKNQIFEYTADFIENRLNIIKEELSDVEKNVEEFKQKNRLTDLTSDSELFTQNTDGYNKGIIGIETELSVLKMVEENLNTEQSDFLPDVAGVSGSNISELVMSYNELIHNKKRLLKGSTEKHPAIITIDNQINQLKQSIKSTLKNTNSTLEIKKKSLQKEYNKFSGRVASIPKFENIFRSIQRQQQIKEGLYLYLLQKREETALVLSATETTVKVIDPAYAGRGSIAPNKRMIYLMALGLGLLIPFGILYLKFLLDNKVQGRKDIESIMRTPILGDIPRSKSDKKIVVSDQDRDATAESFRLIRTNIDFMLSKVDEKSKVIFVSSTLSGEGKTFISINLASVLSLTSKKVLLIGADIRKPKITDYLDVKEGKGLTHFLMDDNLHVSEVIDTIEEYNFDMLHSGIIAPNPSELLMNGRFDKVIEYGKANYDYIIVDTAPVNLVTDTLLLSDHAHLFIYVTRAGYLDKRLLEIPKKLYEEKRLPNMTILLNDTNSEKGYGYGYGYGYGEEVEKKKWWQIFSKN